MCLLKLTINGMNFIIQIITAISFDETMTLIVHLLTDLTRNQVILKEREPTLQRIKRLKNRVYLNNVVAKRTRRIDEQIQMKLVKTINIAIIIFVSKDTPVLTTNIIRIDNTEITSSCVLGTIVLLLEVLEDCGDVIGQRIINILIQRRVQKFLFLRLILTLVNNTTILVNFLKKLLKLLLLALLIIAFLVRSRRRHITISLSRLTTTGLHNNSVTSSLTFLLRIVVMTILIKIIINKNDGSDGVITHGTTGFLILLSSTISSGLLFPTLTFAVIFGVKLIKSFSIVAFIPVFADFVEQILDVVLIIRNSITSSFLIIHIIILLNNVINNIEMFSLTTSETNSVIKCFKSVRGLLSLIIVHKNNILFEVNTVIIILKDRLNTFVLKHIEEIRIGFVSGIHQTLRSDKSMRNLMIKNTSDTLFEVIRALHLLKHRFHSLIRNSNLINERFIIRSVSCRADFGINVPPSVITDGNGLQNGLKHVQTDFHSCSPFLVWGRED